jgi:hypothetical protein
MADIYVLMAYLALIVPACIARAVIEKRRNR